MKEKELGEDHEKMQASPTESEIHPSHKSCDLYSAYFAPAEGFRHSDKTNAGAKRKTRMQPIFSCVSLMTPVRDRLLNATLRGAKEVAGHGGNGGENDTA